MECIASTISPMQNLAISSGILSSNLLRSVSKSPPTQQSILDTENMEIKQSSTERQLARKKIKVHQLTLEKNPFTIFFYACEKQSKLVVFCFTSTYLFSIKRYIPLIITVRMTHQHNIIKKPQIKYGSNKQVNHGEFISVLTSITKKMI